MPTNNSSNIDYKSRAKKLKDKGFLNIDLRKRLSKSDKSLITRRYNNYGKFFTNKFIIRRVGNKRIKEMKESGFKTFGNKVILPTDGFNPKQIKIKKNKVVYSGADKSREIMIGPKINFLERLERLTKRKLMRGEFVTVRIGENAPFWRTFKDYAELLNYVTGWTPKSLIDSSEELISQMSVVKYFKG